MLEGPRLLSFEATASKCGAHREHYYVLKAAKKRIDIAIEIKMCRLNLWMESGGCVLEGPRLMTF